MSKLEEWSKKKIREMAKKAVVNSVGKSIYFYGYERTIPEDVKKWIRENK